jgi:hypothetical protein
MANWVQDGSRFILKGANNKAVGAVRQDRETDRGATGWQAYYLGAPRLTTKGYPLGRGMEAVGFFRRLRDAMKHVTVLHKLEE